MTGKASHSSHGAPSRRCDFSHSISYRIQRKLPEHHS